MSILSKADYKTLRGIDGSDRDASIELALLSAEDAILRYTDRDFNTAQLEETKEYPYNGSGILEVDDFIDVPVVQLPDRTLVHNVDFTVGPREGDVFYWIDLHYSAAGAGSPLMGFTRNEDVLAREGLRLFGRTPKPLVIVNVTATFGWPGGAPASVKQAAAWLVDEFATPDDAAAEGLQAKAVADVSEVYVDNHENESPGTGDLPLKIQRLLTPFRRLSV